jgi:hypothetical protein
MFPQTHQILSNPVFSINTTLPAESRSQRLWMCFHEQLHKQKQRAFRHLRCQKTHFRHAANHRKTLYLSRFSGSYPFFTFCIKATHSTCPDGMKKILFEAGAPFTSGYLKKSPKNVIFCCLILLIIIVSNKTFKSMLTS